VTDRVANTLAGVSGLSTVGGISLSQINEVLQAGAFIVAIISGIAATYYYLRKAHK
jgi:thiamine monophosphate synthase